MSGLLGGGGGSQSSMPKQFNSIQTMQSSYGNCLPLVYGRTRIPGTIIWYTNFTATASTDGGGGGKGGGGNTGNTTYTYSASVIIALGEGAMSDVNNTFADKAIHGPGYASGPNPWVGTGSALSDLGFTFFAGTVGQTAWTYPAGTPSAQQLAYSSTAYLTCSNFSLGSSAAMPNMTFEVDGLLSSLSSPYKTTAGDIDPASITYDYCSDPTHGCGFGPYYGLNRNNGVAAIVYVNVASGQGTTAGSPCTISTRTGFSVSSYTGSGTTGTLVFSGGTNTPAGQTVVLAGFTPAALNGTYVVQSSVGSGATLTFNYPSGWPGNASVLGTMDVVVTPQTMPVGTVITNASVFPSGATITSWNTFNNTFTVGTAASALGSNAACTYSPSTWQSYCLAYGFFTSPAETTQRAAQDFMTEMLTISNSDSIWSNGQQVIVPLNDSSVTGNGYTHIPNNGTGGSFSTPIYNFTDDDYISQQGDAGAADPVIVIRKGVSATYNKVNVEFLDRSNQYNTSIAQAFDANDIAINGERVMDTVTLHQICDNTVARLVAQLILQRQLYYKNSYRFEIRADYCLLEPMDVIGVTDSGLGIINALCRIDTIEEADDGTLTIECTELPFGPGVTPQYNYQAGSRGWYLANVAPGVVRTPYFIPVPPQLQQGNSGYELYIAVNGVNTSTVWGGCRVWMSYDNSNYVNVGTITGGARYGTTSGAYATGAVGGLDTVNFLTLVLNESTFTMAAASAPSDADNARTLLWVDGEWMAYEYCTLISAGTYGMSATGLTGGAKYMQRALYGSNNITHASGAQWARIDGSIFRIALGAGIEQQTVYFKFQSFNIYGKAMNSLASETAYTYVVGSNYAGQGGTSTVWKNAGYGSSVAQTLYKINNATTVGAWDTNVYSGNSFSGGAAISWQVIESATTEFMVGLADNPTATAVVGSMYSNVAYALYCNAGDINIYEGVSGSTTRQNRAGSATFSFGSYVAGDTFSVSYDGKFVRYHHNGQLLRATQPTKQQLTLYGCFAAYQPGCTATNVSFNSLSQDGALVSNFLSTQAWKVGTTGAQGNFGDYNAGGVASSIVLAPGPYGTTEVQWQANNCGVGKTNWNGGCYNGPTPVTAGLGYDLAGIDPSKTYRYSVWFQYSGGTPGGGVYLGCDEYGATLDLATGSVNSNPYFCYISPASGLVAGNWYLFVGVLHGSGYTGTTSTGVSGIYDPVTGLKSTAAGITTQEYKQQSNYNFNQTIRFGMFNNVQAGLIGRFARPRVEEINGTEPSINSMLNSASSGQIGSNAVSQIASTYAATGTGASGGPGSSGPTAVASVVATTTGAPVSVDLTGSFSVSLVPSAHAATCVYQLYMDGSAVASTPTFDVVANGAVNSTAGALVGNFALVCNLTPSAASHTFTLELAWSVAGTSGTVVFTTTQVGIKVREIKK